jgi:Anaphase-promoting complex subunit 4 WD40 domain
MSPTMDLFASISPFRTAVRVHRSIAWKKTLTLGKKELGTSTTTITATNWSPTGQQVVVGLENGSVRVFTLEGGIERASFQKAHAMPVTRVVWAAQQQRAQLSEQDEVCHGVSCIRTIMLHMLKPLKMYIAVSHQLVATVFCFVTGRR